MKNVFRMLAAVTLLLAVTVITGCNHNPYTGRYIDIECLKGIPESECNEYKDANTGREQLTAFYRLRNTERYSYDKKSGLKESEVVTYLKGNNIKEQDATEIVDIARTLSKGNGFLQSFYYTKNNDKYYDIYFFVLAD